ncbi:hypothetical protein MMC31_007887, partial [Peltigera leucophlebia]|nr:hypothetical protein [Peltigera leucophlebia]
MFNYLSTNEPADFNKYKELIILDVETLRESARITHHHITQPWKDFKFESENFALTISLLVLFPLSHISHAISIEDILPILQFNFAIDILPGQNWTKETLLQLHQFLLDVNDYPELGITLKSEMDSMHPSMQIHMAEYIRKLVAVATKALAERNSGELGRRL